MKHIKKILFLLFLGFPLSVFSQDISSQDKNLQEILSLNSRLELFVDSFLIDHMDGVILKMATPKDEGPVLHFDKPWEGPFCGYSTVIKDGDKYHLYYRGLPAAGANGSSIETTCYAESSDGICWIKPELGLFEVKGNRKNNIVLANAAPVTHNFSPFRDARPGIPSSEIFKALGGTHEGLYAYTSGDGISWKKMAYDPVLTKGIFDSQNVSFWSESENCYVCYFRTWTGEGYNGFRTVSRSTSYDFLNWTDPVEMDFGDTPREHIYTNQTSPYFRAPHIYISIAARFMPGKKVLTEQQAEKFNVNPRYFNDCSDAVLMSTRGSNKYERLFLEGFLRPGIGLNNWVSRTNYPALNIVQTGPFEMSFYVNQDYAQPTAHLHRYSLRIDGFVSVSASYKGGIFVTRPFTFTGSRLILNYSTSAAGGIKVEILDKEGNPIEGFNIDESIELIGNEIERVVEWQKGSDLSFFKGKVIRLRFTMKDADLYSLKFQ